MKLNSKNKEEFKFQEAVSLYLDIKNIHEIDIRVFEFNSAAYYKKTMNPIDTSIRL